VKATAEPIALTLGLTLGKPIDVIDRIREGFPSSSLAALRASTNLSRADLARLLRLPERSFARRVTGKRLSPAESDVVYRIARIFEIARDALGTEEKAACWLSKRNRALGGGVPLQLLDTEAGGREVEGLIGRILYGTFS
jgi:putative toxin-antitoxin system antitoxin component (TIGR02293 family)